MRLSCDKGVSGDDDILTEKGGGEGRPTGEGAFNSHVEASFRPQCYSGWVCASSLSNGDSYNDENSSTNDMKSDQPSRRVDRSRDKLVSMNGHRRLHVSRYFERPS